MKKIKFINLILLTFVSFSFYNCNKEPFEDTSEQAKNSEFLSNIKQENTTLDEVKKDLYLNPILSNASKKIRIDGVSSKNINLESLNLSNQVKKYTLDDYTSYTIPIINEFGDSYIFQNLVIEKDILRDAVYLITYYPDENYKESIKKHLVNINDNIDYTGSKKIDILYYKRKVNIEEKIVTAKTAKSSSETFPDDDVDEPYTVCIETYTPKKCSAGGHHSPGEPCSGTGSQRAGWVVSVSCINIIPQVPNTPGPGPGCTGCANPVSGTTGAGAYFPPDSQNPNWLPEYICVAMERGNCTKVIPYTPILTTQMIDPYFNYINIFDRNKFDLFNRFENQDIRTVIDEYLDSHKNYMGSYDIETINLVNNVFDAAIANRAPSSFEGSLTDVWASLRSPVNVDRTSIDNNTTEGKKFNSTYNALTQSPTFQKLFVDLFDNSDRFNVKFEIADHVYDKDEPTKEINANTTRTVGTNDITIQINKQILIPNTDKSQINIENAKTILHECIHAYLFIKANNPSVGADFVKILNSMYPTINEQHDFMYDKMIPTMQNVLSEIRDLVTTSAGRNVLETEYTMRPTAITNPSASTPWIWNEYYKYISLNGLQETSCFIQDFPNGTDQLYLLSKYIEYGHKELKP
ncbi:SprT family zinc-dependent metalloprotease [Flavobacterium phragmitis]|uniref:SprT-like family protein n=1 Tax=Flavobacterium phragmitis TaxID=739143 RepID=A0A1I1K2N9_9FLAO|nr:hypothetical protein [Flavobacterium phragmitis]SFC55227.1 hypothetical protein SAMN05216297_101230 [Flavobacterium phragmitis]